MTTDTAVGRVAHARVVDEPLDVPAHLAAVTGPAIGATDVFVGTIRDHDPDAAGSVVQLEYEAHPDAEGVLTAMSARVAQATGATIAVSAPIQAAPASIISGSGAAGSNDLALAVSRLQGNAAIDGAYKAFVAKVGGDLNEASRLQGNAQVLTDSVENRRQSVAGVSMDEEMSNLVRFQRAYQASARAMSTMDEMLDVLINRTGRVGL